MSAPYFSLALLYLLPCGWTALAAVEQTLAPEVVDALSTELDAASNKAEDSGESAQVEAENPVVTELKAALAEREESGESMELLGRIGDLYARLGDAPRAVIAFERAISEYGGTEELYFRLALLLLSAGRGELGLETLKIGVAAFPESANLHGELGKAYKAFDKQYAAISAFNRARAIDSSNVVVAYELADIYRWQKKYERAKEIIAEFGEGDAVAPHVAMLYADVLIGVGDAREAVGVMEKQLEGHPDSSDVRRMLSHAYHSYALSESEAGRVEEAIRTMESAIEIMPEDFDAVGTLGMLHFEAGQHEKAASIFQNLVEQHPEYLQGHAMHGTMLRTQDRADDAKKAFSEGLARAQAAKDEAEIQRYNSLLGTFPAE